MGAHSRTRYARAIGSDTPRMTITPRQFATALGVLMAIAGLVALTIPVHTFADSGLFGTYEIDCGTALADNTAALGGDPLAQCRDALGTRRAWGWPLLLAGVVVAAGAVFVAQRRQPNHEAVEND